MDNFVNDIGVLFNWQLLARFMTQFCLICLLKAGPRNKISQCKYYQLCCWDRGC